MALRSAQALIHMSTRGISWGLKAAGTSVQPYHLQAPIVLKSGSFNFLEPSVLVQGLLYLFTQRFRNWLCFHHHVKVIKKYSFWVYMFCGGCVLRRFGGSYCLHLTLKKEAVPSCEMSEHTPTTRYRNRTEDHQLINNRRENVRNLQVNFVL